MIVTATQQAAMRAAAQVFLAEIGKSDVSGNLVTDTPRQIAFNTLQAAVGALIVAMEEHPYDLLAYAIGCEVASLLVQQGPGEQQRIMAGLNAGLKVGYREAVEAFRPQGQA